MVARHNAAASGRSVITRQCQEAAFLPFGDRVSLSRYLAISLSRYLAISLSRYLGVEVDVNFHDRRLAAVLG